MNYEEFKDQIDQLRKTCTVIEICHDDAPNDVADGFVSFLQKEGYKVEVLNHGAIPSLYYKIDKKEL